VSDLVELAAELRNRGMSLAQWAQDSKSACWSERAYEAIVAIARLSPTVHVDQVLAIFDDKPVHHNAWGAPWHRAIKDRVIAHSGRVKPSADISKHRHQSPVYNSLIYGRNR
jgi:hypothetical protein